MRSEWLKEEMTNSKIKNNIGFGEIDVEADSLNLKHLKAVDLECFPFFVSLEGKEKACPVADIPKQKACFCNRFGLVGPPVLPAGPLDAEFVFVGRDPGEMEVEFGIPFHPDAPGGKIFGEYLALLQLRRENVYIINSVFCRGMGNVPPNSDELMACARFHYGVFKGLSQVKYVFALGTHAFLTMTGVYSSVSSYVGKYFKTKMMYEDREVKIVCLDHPESLLRRERLVKKNFDILEGLRK